MMICLDRGRPRLATQRYRHCSLFLETGVRLNFRSAKISNIELSSIVSCSDRDVVHVQCTHGICVGINGLYSTSGSKPD